MKYMEGGGFQNHPLMRLTIGLTLVLLMAFCVTNLGLYFSKMGFDPASVVAPGRSFLFSAMRDTTPNPRCLRVLKRIRPTTSL